MTKRIIGIMLLIVLCGALFAACGERYKIDKGGEKNSEWKPSALARVMIKKNRYPREEEISMVVGFGSPRSALENYMGLKMPMTFRMKLGDFCIVKEDGAEVHTFERIIANYIKEEFVVKETRRRYIPNHYETFKIHFSSEEEFVEGNLLILAGFDSGEKNGFDGEGAAVFYAANHETIVFSTESIEDAKKKLAK